jgi:RHS repeat-associated protein
VKCWIYSGQLSPVAELDSAGNVISQFVGNYIIKNGNTYQLVTDHLGSVRLVVDVATGDVAQKIDYDEFGNIISDSNPDFQPFAYAGGMYDTQTKLIRFGVRDYNASIGRWTIKDPILFAGGETSLYGYVGNDPINYIDPSGLKQCKGKGRILEGNPALIGKQGGFPRTKVATNSIAVIPSQWGGNKAMRPYLSQISGTAGGVSFSGVTDVVGSSEVKNVQSKLMNDNPGNLILEFVSGKDLGNDVDVTLNIPDGMPCPEGTTETVVCPTGPSARPGTSVPR